MAIKTIKHEAIVVLIAHRLSTIEDDDEIVVLQSGKILERGTHNELISHQGLYWQFYEAASTSVVETALVTD